MSENMDILKNDPQQLAFVAFDVEKEPWNKYKLQDGSLLKTKFILINILAPKGIDSVIKNAKEKGEVALDLAIQSSTIVGVEVQPNLIGKPMNIVCSAQELEESIIESDLEVEAISESQNRYVIHFKDSGDAELKMKVSPVRVSKTSKFDQYGIPLYVVNFNAEARITKKVNDQSVKEATPSNSIKDK
jgi:hypothetical protein